VFFGKYISVNGEFRGLLRGHWEYDRNEERRAHQCFSLFGFLTRAAFNFCVVKIASRIRR